MRHHLASLCVFLRAENQNTPPCCIQQGNICLSLKHWSALLFSSSSSYLPLVEWRTNPSLGCKYVYIIKFLRFLTKFLKIKFLIYHWKEKPSFWQEPQSQVFFSVQNISRTLRFKICSGLQTFEYLSDYQQKLRMNAYRKITYHVFKFRNYFIFNS